MDRKRWICLKGVLCWFHSPRGPWSVIPVTLSNQIISFDDSQGIHFKFCVENIRKYLLSEARGKRSEFFQGWQTDVTKCIPQQKNGNDRGIFCSTHTKRHCKCLSRGQSFQCSLEDMLECGRGFTSCCVSAGSWAETQQELWEVWPSQSRWFCCLNLQTLIWVFTDISDQWCWATLATSGLSFCPYSFLQLPCTIF